MKAIIFGISTFITLLVAMYYRKQRIKNHKITIEEMKRPQLTVVPENVTSHLIATIEKLSKTFDTKMEPEMRKYRLLVNSSQRNATTYPTTTDYQLQLPETIYGMEKLSLEKAVFPVPPSNLQFTIDCRMASPPNVIKTFNVIVAPGNYTMATFSDAIAAAMNAAMVADTDQTTPAVWTVTIDAFLIMRITLLTFPVFVSVGTPNTVRVDIDGASCNLNLITAMGYSATGTTSGGPSAAPVAVTGNIAVTLEFPCNIIVYLDNKTTSFNSLRIMKNSDTDERCFAHFNIPSKNMTSSTDTRDTYTILKNETNAYYKAYEGPVQSFRFINVKIRQLMTDGTLTIPDFGGNNHSMEFEMKAKVDKISATLV